MASTKIMRLRGFTNETVEELLVQAEEPDNDGPKFCKKLIGKIKSMAKLIENKTILHVNAVTLDVSTFVARTEQGITVNIFSPLQQGDKDLEFVSRNLVGERVTIDDVKRKFPNFYVSWF